MDILMLFITVTSAFTLDHIEQVIIWATIELPVSPWQEAQGQMRKWNIRFQQELTLVFVTRSRDGNKKAGSSTVKHRFTSTTPFPWFQLRIWDWETRGSQLGLCTAQKVSIISTNNCTETAGKGSLAV